MTWAKKLTITAQNATISYRPAPKNQDLDQIFCLKLNRSIRKNHTILFENEGYGITYNLPHSIAGKNAEIRIYSNGSLRGFYGGRDLELKTEWKGCWGKHEKPKDAPGLTTWLRVLGTDLSVHSSLVE